MTRLWRYITLFRRLFGPVDKLDTREIEEMGLLAVKIAQMYAIRGDILGTDKVEKLQRLYEHASPMEDGLFEEVFEKEAPIALKEALDHLEKQPLAVASLGQVHRARLKDGSEVIIKVLREDHASKFKRDARAVRLLVRFALFFYPPLERLADPMGTLDNIVSMTETEMNLTAEITGTNRLRELRDRGVERHAHLADLKFPRVYEEFTRSGIMVSEFVDAKSVSSLLDGGEFHYDSLLQLFRIHGYYLFHLGEFHGDFHPGNIHHDGDKFWFIDNANVEKVDREFTSGLLRFMEHLGRQNNEEAAEAIASLALEPLPNPEVFKTGFNLLYNEFGGRPIGEQSLTNQMMKTVRLAVESGMEFPHGAFPVIKSLMYLDGMALSCSPDKVLLDDVVEFADDFR